MSLVIRDAAAADAEAVCAIYNAHVRGTIVTFEEDDVPPAEMTRRIEAVTAAGLPWLVANEAGSLAGYAYAAKWHPRAAYRHAVETTVYVDETACRRGIGTALYRALLERLRRMPVRTAIGVVALPNPASAALHERCGFRKVGHLERVGCKFGRWIDVGFWQIVW